MTRKAKAKHAEVLISNVHEVDRLSQIHGQITDKGPGYKHDVQILHKSAIILLVACWEAYVEDLAVASLEHMISTAKDHTVFSKYVLERVGSNHSGVKAWKLAGTGWKKVLRDNMKGVLAKTTGVFNTPRTDQVNKLFQKTIGLTSLSSSWYWPGRSVQQTTKALDGLVTLRGSIAHRVTSTKSVTLEHVKDARSFVYRLSVKSHNRLCDYLEVQVGNSPWLRMVFKGTK